MITLPLSILERIHSLKGMPGCPGFKCCTVCRLSIPLSDRYSQCVKCLSEAHIPQKCLHSHNLKACTRKVRDLQLKLLLMEKSLCLASEPEVRIPPGQKLSTALISTARNGPQVSARTCLRLLGHHDLHPTCKTTQAVSTSLAPDKLRRTQAQHKQAHHYAQYSQGFPFMVDQSRQRQQGDAIPTESTITHHHHERIPPRFRGHICKHTSYRANGLWRSPIFVSTCWN